MTPKSVILSPGNSEECKFDILPNDEGPFEYKIIISTKEKTYRIKIIGKIILILFYIYTTNIIIIFFFQYFLIILYRY